MKIKIGTLTLLCLLHFAGNQVVAQIIDKQLLEGIKPRSIGPAAMSGRITAVDVVASNPDIIYIGSASGGLWKSVSGGIYWEPIFDKEKTQAIGSISILQKNSNIIWVGTGEGNPRNSVSSGNGIYRSLDAGKTWENMGLELTRNIHRIIVHPENENIVYVGATGFPWAETPDRGLYKTIDGGKSWEKILYVNETTGVGDMIMDPTNPNKLLVGMWDHRRWPWFFRSGGPGSGLYLTINGGKTWKKLGPEDGLPKGDLGRIGIAICRKHPNVLYALIESKKNALYRSDDGGYKWTKVSDKNIGNRPFYFAEIYVDPENENRVYNLFTFVTVSQDGGKTFENLLPEQGSGDIHVDHHAFYVNPANPDYLIDGNDGGMAISRDKGKTWSFIENLPLGQFYHISIDAAQPYNVYGGLQDNGSWVGPAYIWRYGELRNTYWQTVNGGDGFDILPDLNNNRYGYAMSQEGYLMHYDVISGASEFIRPIHPDGTELRFNWNAGIAQSPYENNTLYFGSQFLHKTTDGGRSWSLISGDLTTNNPEMLKQDQSGGLTFDVTGAENHCTIISIAPSPVKKGVIWVGTDDGCLQLTTDEGNSWTNVYARIKGLPGGCWIPQVRASAFNANEAYVVLNNYRQNDWKPYVFRTQDLGKTWENIVNTSQVEGYALSFIQDPVEPNLFFLGSEFGLYFSTDAGKNWNKWENGYPSVSTMDLAIQPRERDLAIGTFGRSFYILDDIQFLREIASGGPGVLNQTIHLFAPSDAIRANYQSPQGINGPGDAAFFGKNRAAGASISYSVKDTSSGSKVKMEVVNSEGQTIRTMKFAPLPGMNRISWNLDRKGIRFPSIETPPVVDEEPGGPNVLPGTYKIRLSYKDAKDSGTIKVSYDPRVPFVMEDLLASDRLMDTLIHYAELVTRIYDQLNNAQKSIDMVVQQAGSDTSMTALVKYSNSMKDSIKLMKEVFTGKEDIQGFVSENNRVLRYLWQSQSYLASSWRAPSPSSLVALNLFKRDLALTISKVNAFFEKQWSKYQEKVKEADLSPFKPITMYQLK